MHAVSTFLRVDLKNGEISSRRWPCSSDSFHPLSVARPRAPRIVTPVGFLLDVNPHDSVIFITCLKQDLAACDDLVL